MHENPLTPNLMKVECRKITLKKVYYRIFNLPEANVNGKI